MTTTPKFDFNGHQLRSVLIDGEPWFVAADACRCLGMDVSKGTDHHCRKLDKDERGLVSRNDHPVLFTGCRASLLAIISRPGLFKLIQRSNKPEAKEFDRWVRHEVLPQVMDNGGYMLPGAGPNQAVSW